MPSIPRSLTWIPALLVPFLTGPNAAHAQTGWSAFELAELTSSDGLPNDHFGFSVDIDGGTAVVGAKQKNGEAHGLPGGEGAVYVFERDAGYPHTWSETKRLTVPGSRNLGHAVAVSGDTIAAISLQSPGTWYGVLHMYERNAGGAGNWGEVATIVTTEPWFGSALDLCGDTLVAGAATGAGAAYVHERNQGGASAWGEAAVLSANSIQLNDAFGQSVAIDGDTIVVGAHRQDIAGKQSAGAAYVFYRDATAPQGWREIQQLVASDGEASDLLGTSAAVAGDMIVVGAEWDDHTPGVSGHAGGSGSAYVYERDQGGPDDWGEVTKLVASDARGANEFGYSAAAWGTAIVIGARRKNLINGGAYVFDRDLLGPATWAEVAKLEGFGYFGASVSVSHESVLVGAFLTYVGGNLDQGAAYVYVPTFQEAYCTAGTSANGCSAAIASTGLPSATRTSGFDVSASAVEGGKDGLFFFGVNGKQANPWGNGTSFQCVVPPVQRAGLLNGTGTPGACDGYFAQDLNALWCPGCPKPNLNPGPGTFAQAQLWYRDPASTSNQTTSLSDAVEFLVGP